MVLVVDPETRAAVGEGEVGEIWVDSPSKARGYFEHPTETEVKMCVLGFLCLCMGEAQSVRPSVSSCFLWCCRLIHVCIMFIYHHHRMPSMPAWRRAARTRRWRSGRTCGRATSGSCTMGCVDGN